MTIRIGRRTFLASLGALGLSRIARAQAAPAPGFAFAVLNDLHVKDAASADALLPAIADINARKDVLFTAVIGDLASDALPEELTGAKRLLDNLTKPYHVLPGNHDATNEPGATLTAYEAVFGAPCWSHTYGGWHFLGLDSTEGTKSDVTVAPERLAWLDTAVAALPPGAPVALLLHHPLNPHSKAFRIKNADDILARFKDRPLRLAAAGHFHGNQDETHDNILFTTTACCSVTRGNHDGTKIKGYRLYHCNANQITAQFIPIPLGA
jgi:3',5'-cyclic AMP phosphodiesterase CpdA